MMVENNSTNRRILKLYTKRVLNKFYKCYIFSGRRINMDQIKIGKFIAELRKEKNMTQQQLGDKIGVSYKAISKWENGRGLPELSTLKPLSEELGISINELLSGEKIAKEDLQEKIETNIINTIDYSNKKIEDEHKKISIILMILGTIISISALTIFEKESSWCSLYSIIGIVIFVIGLVRELKKFKKIQKIGIGLILFIGIFGIFYLIDYIGVKTNNRPPIYNLCIETRFIESKEIAYYSLFYNVYRINADTPNEYYIIDEKKEYNFDTIPITPFNRNKSGIENISKYQNKYVGNNSNTGNLINNLPLSEYGYVFEIDSEKLGLTIDYHITDWYINADLYLQKSLIYNSIAIFSLIDNVQYINYNFSGNSYRIDKTSVEEKYPNFNKIKENENINKDKFNQYVEDKMNDEEFIEKVFEDIFKK